eukprot:CAMPEP_0202825850 /NCGR_PEP_ID=MMETSP1389-20130828/13257_1 /ASSEMBLY_ACC=CAM_ASM_000865 /TAXON_ID=302021 /ORGANISM="Rhodomonas sp., Strain CCMP768" /LENGTH=131 /DNA_ID=CAMNT_0049499099 /DNA_START=26 /DNA_END=421 /DNA_ORIENTATION=-
MQHRDVLPFLALLVCCCLSVSVAKPLSLTADDFEDRTGGSNTFIKFFAPWCGHCQRLAPTWDALADRVDAELAGAVKVAKVDCTVEHDLCNKYSVRGYPTLILLTKSGDKVPYSGAREAEPLFAFSKEHAA